MNLQFVLIFDYLDCRLITEIQNPHMSDLKYFQSSRAGHLAVYCTWVLTQISLVFSFFIFLS